MQNKPCPPHRVQSSLDLTDGGVPDLEDAETPWGKLRASVCVCTRCRLSLTRTRVVFGDGPADAKLMFIGEAPGAQENEVGLPFVGRSGQLLARILNENGIQREQVFISNIVRCRPPENRDPRPDEIAACSPWLDKQIQLINPALLCVLGRHAASTLLGRPVKIMQEHGQWLEFKDRKLLIALHPSAALRMPKFREGFEEDMRSVAEEYRRLSQEKNGG